MTEDILNGSKDHELKILLEPNYPLLLKFKEICPGTYKHCQTVSSIMEGIATELGLDVTAMKVMGQYHDIGKMLNPKYFIENQTANENPHDNIDPYLSYQLISKHVSDTVLILLNDEKFPRRLIQIISQHHGTTIVRYFFDKSKSSSDDMFRYKCMKPTCVESAVLMICDCVEAKSRTYTTQFNPVDLVNDTINNLMSDNQLDEVVMRLGDLQKIKLALSKELEGTYQKRIDYKKAKEEL